VERESKAKQGEAAVHCYFQIIGPGWWRAGEFVVDKQLCGK
jgi:hypothetical protein